MRIKLAQRQSKATPGRAEGQVGQVRDEASSRSTGGQVVGSLNKTAQKQKKKKKKRYPKRTEPNVGAGAQPERQRERDTTERDSNRRCMWVCFCKKGITKKQETELVFGAVFCKAREQGRQEGSRESEERV